MTRPTDGAHTALLRRPDRAPAPRILAPDLARGCMLLLIAMAYAPVYTTGGEAGGYGRRPGGSALDQAVSFASTLVVENRAFPMFGILFGYGLVMLVDGHRRKGLDERESRRLLRRRSLWLLVFGTVHTVLAYTAEILAAYGIAGLTIGLLVYKPQIRLRRALAILAPVYACTSVILMLVLASDSGTLVHPGYATAEDWTLRLVGIVVGPLANTLMFPMFVFVVVGIWAARKRLLDRPADNAPLLRRLAVAGVAVSLAGALPLALAGAGAFEVGDLAYGVLNTVQELTGVFGGIGYVALFGLLALRLTDRQGPGTRLLAAAGRRSLSVYLFISLALALVMNHDLIGVGDAVGKAGAVGVALAVWTVGVLAARVLDAEGRQGPAETLLRYLVGRA
ncbi:DUF418 domain-containing protein [Glycomyces mayteni]|uniref:DUF418 domain-containing protein n=1 Tax=Glycomyces mayteni TaxID=543887 RepID=A0ABW2D9H6_9ACTN|nr:DUF418 domain-containing protein [Glycomyces mayteni]